MQSKGTIGICASFGAFICERDVTGMPKNHANTEKSPHNFRVPKHSRYARPHDGAHWHCNADVTRLFKPEALLSQTFTIDTFLLLRMAKYTFLEMPKHTIKERL
jgi:hypothetical protein